MKKSIFAIALCLWLLTYNSISALSAPVDDGGSKSEFLSMPIESNEVPNWPTGPEISAKAAILIEANTGVVLYAKNVHEHMYPASTTKLMTALIAYENSALDDIVNFSYDAVFSLEPGSANIGIDPGQAMDMEECLYGIMVGSANEVANAIAEHVGGSMDGFADMMNAKVNSLGLKDTHFTNANGLQNEEHYTSAYDLAMIAKEFFSYEALTKIGNTPSYHFEATSTQPDDFYVRNKHKLINGEVAYEGIKGGKTGYTSVANECLVTCDEQNGMKLICVVMNEDSPKQFYDTVTLFDYGYSNFQVMNVAENDNKYTIESTNLFPNTVDVLGNSSPILELNKDDYIIMPKNVTFNELESKPDYNTKEASSIAYIDYSYHGVYLGRGIVNLSSETYITSAFDKDLVLDKEVKEIERVKPIFVNVKIVTVFAGGLCLLVVITTILLSAYTHRTEIRRRRRLRR